MKIRISGTVSESIVDGPGFRYTIFVQGCPHHCKGCHNPQTHDFEGGRVVDTDELFRECAEDPLNKGVTFSGGEPFAQPKALYELGKRFKERGYDIWCYTGWTIEELWKMNDEFVGKLLSIIDVLVDGRFVEDKRSLSLPFRGSENQRLIDMKATRDTVIEYTP
ncbi:MAG: anaerobic ribonucleoside-triphosphate reductase activating protein [Ruminococcaceae bacterium]|nr:anaerobic ribonucleoside-triphosphate reductase activating protein [Oscillospiraceae bacterium]